MKRTHLSKSLAGLAAGSMIAGAALLPSSARAQGFINTVNFSGTVNQIFGNGGGVANGSSVSGTINFNSADFLLLTYGSVGSTYTNAGATVTVNVNGQVSTYQGINAEVAVNTTDFSSPAVPADSLSIGWGPGGNSGILIYSSLGTVANNSAASIAGGQWWANRIQSNPYDSTVAVNVDAANINGAQGNLTSYVQTTPEPSALALGGLGTAGLLVLNRMRRQPEKNHISMR